MKMKSLGQIHRKGSTTVVFVFLLNIVLILGVFICEYSYLKLAKTELRIAVDACTRAASAEYGVSKNLDKAVAAAQSMANRYQVGRREFSLEPQDIVSGSITPRMDGTYQFSLGASPINAFRIATGVCVEKR